MAEVIGPDSSLSWLVVGACFIINSVTYGLIRSHGIFYVAVLSEFPGSRSAATWPFSICIATTHLVAPLAGALCQKFGTRSVIFGGTLLASIGFLACSFANNINQLSILFGLLHGFGLGLAIMPVPVTINQFFVKHRASAQGVAFSGSTIASFAYPALLEYCVREYGLRGTFILSAGIVLHALIGAVIIVRPPWIQPPKIKEVPLRPPLKLHSVAPSISLPSKGAWEDIESREIPMTEVEFNEIDIRRGSLLSEEKTCPYSRYNPNLQQDSQSIHPSPTPERAPSSDPVYEEEVIKPLTLLERLQSLLLSFLQSIASGFSTIFNVVGNPMFPLIAFSWCVFLFIFLTFILIVGDFAKDQGIPPSKAVFIFSAFSVGDLFGRLGLGWVTDKKYLKRKTFAAISMTLMGLIILILPVGTSYELLLAESIFLGMLVGSTLMIFFVLYAEYFKPEHVALAIGLNTALNGLAAFARPVVIGYFRDTLGSYSYLFYVCGSLLIFTSLTWLLEPWLLRLQKARERRVQDISTIS